MHHAIKPAELKELRDKEFAEWWDREAGESPGLAPLRELGKVLFDKGFSVGLIAGFEQGAKSAGAVIQSDIVDIMEGKHPF